MSKSENPYDRVKNDAIVETGAKMDSWIGGVPLPSIDSIAIFAIDAVVPVLEISPCLHCAALAVWHGAHGGR